MSKEKVEIKVGGWFCELLTVLFIGLKLTGFIAWSWWWVLSPLWIPVVIVLAIVVVVLLVLGLIKLVD
jgi:hypothetical protein